MTIPYNLSVTDEMSALTVKVNGELRVATGDHPQWQRLVEIVSTPDNEHLANELARLLDPAQAVNDYFAQVTERVSVRNGQVLVDGDPVSGVLIDRILEYMDKNQDALPLALFLEKVVTNSNEHSRNQLYRYLEKHNLTITEEGNFLAYKGVNPAYRDDVDTNLYPYQSISHGTAVVDGVEFVGAIPNGVGAVVTMPRSEVVHDPSVACNTGLHAGTWSYASAFSRGKVLLVEVNPRDVVSVPVDSNDQKIRCCRYTVVGVADSESAADDYVNGVLDDEDDDYDYEDYDY